MQFAPCSAFPIPIPDDVAALKAIALASRAELRDRDLLIEKLKHQLAVLRRQRFGATSEALDQLDLGLEDEEIARAAEVIPEPTPGAKKQPKRRPLPDHLLREETVLTPGERCIACGGHVGALEQRSAKCLRRTAMDCPARRHSFPG